MYKPKQIRGQGLVEFALILPVLLLLIIGTLELGSAFFVKVELQNSAREGAYYITNNTADGKANGFALTKQAVQIEGENSGVTIPAGDIEVTCWVGTSVDINCSSGSTVAVIVRHEMALAVDFFFNGPLELSADARMLIP